MFLSQPQNMQNSVKNSIIQNASSIKNDLNSEELYEVAHTSGEGKLSSHGALVVKTGKHTGRSANDKFFVKESINDQKIHWGETNVPISEEYYSKIADAFIDFSKDKSLYLHNLMGGADRNHSLNVSIITEYAWHGLFARHLLVRPNADELEHFNPEYTIVNFPSLKMDPSIHGTNSETVIAVNLAEKIILIAGTEYAGETKKSVFTLLNFLLPEKNIMPMHCSVNTGENGDAAIFFGLSGTGKTTLSADPKRSLLGDDEHGWSDEGLFNFEGGCYAKLIRLSEEAEPEIYATTQMKGTVIENAVMKDDGTKILENSTGALTGTVSSVSNHSASGLSDINYTSSPAAGQVLAWDASNNYWEPVNPTNTTDSVSEGSNSFYFTDDRVNAIINANAGLAKSYATNTGSPLDGDINISVNTSEGVKIDGDDVVMDKTIVSTAPSGVGSTSSGHLWFVV